MPPRSKRILVAHLRKFCFELDNDDEVSMRVVREILGIAGHRNLGIVADWDVLKLGLNVLYEGNFDISEVNHRRSHVSR